jgi:stage II sporulation protein D
VVRVLLTAANAPARGYLQVAPAAGLAVRPAGGSPTTLPTQTPSQQAITGWRLHLHGRTVVLRDRAAGRWHTFSTVGSGAALTDSTAELTLAEPGGSAPYRGSLVANVESGHLAAVNVVNLELYLQSVVAAEMSSSWAPAALEAQAVAARTYATREIAHPKGSFFDLYGDTRDQAYPGASSEAPRSTQAVKATAGEIVVNLADRAVLTQYSSSDGGWTVSGGVSYLPAQRDPYDGEMPNSAHAWRSSIAASSIEAAYPKVGTLRDVEITARDGNGIWGGRVTSLALVGTKATVTVSGTDFQFALGLRSYWFRPVPTPGPPRSLKATAAGKTVTATWKAPAPVAGAAAVTGYALLLSPGTHHQTLAPGALTATVANLPAGTYTVTLTALSSAGAGPSVKSTVQVTS